MDMSFVMGAKSLSMRRIMPHDVELATIVHALKMRRHYLMGNTFELRTNHRGLKYLFAY